MSKDFLNSAIFGTTTISGVPLYNFVTKNGRAWCNTFLDLHSNVH